MNALLNNYIIETLFKARKTNSGGIAMENNYLEVKLWEEDVEIPTYPVGAPELKIWYSTIRKSPDMEKVFL